MPLTLSQPAESLSSANNIRDSRSYTGSLGDCSFDLKVHVSRVRIRPVSWVRQLTVSVVVMVGATSVVLSV